MKNKSSIVLIIFCFTAIFSCSQDNKSIEKVAVEAENKNKQEPHNYGGWYCPDNLNGFPAVDIGNWESVPVVNGRLATKEETQTESSLIFVDITKYPDAKPLNIKMPKLARYYNDYSNKEEIIIVIQAINISNDSIVGFRYLNGGNGSSFLNEVEFISDSEIKEITASRFVSFDITINAAKNKVWDILTKIEHNETLQSIYDKENNLQYGWNKSPNVNFKYLNEDLITSEFVGDLFGNKYIQIDFELDNYQYVEKFLLVENEEKKSTELKIVCGPYLDDYENQKHILTKWAQKVKELSEGE